MDKENVIQVKSYNFALRIVKLYEFLKFQKREYVMSQQLLKCGTSIGANVSESEFAQTRADFGTKMSIALKEARESKYWLNLLHDSHYLTDRQFYSIHDDCLQIINILTAITKKVFYK